MPYLNISLDGEFHVFILVEICTGAQQTSAKART